MTGKFAENDKCECLPKLISVNDASFATFHDIIVAPRKGIQDNLEFWIPVFVSGTWIPDYNP